MSSQVLPDSILYAGSIDLTATTFIAGISWGIMTAFYSVCMYGLIRNLRSEKATKKTALLAIWITALWIFSTLSTLANAIGTIYAFSWQMNYPGGPESYVLDTWNKPLPILTVAAFILTMWFADGMMLWRLFVFYHGVHRLTRGLILSLVFLIYIGILGTGCAMLAIISFNQTLFSTYALKISIPCFMLSVTLNVLATAFISIRLLLFKRTMEKALGRKEAQASPYTSTAAMLIESAALYAIWSLAFIVVYVMNSPGQFVMVDTFCNVQVISPVMIVYRVSKGLGWEQTTSAKLTTMTHMAFAERQVELAESDTTLETQDNEEDQREDKTSAGMVFALTRESAVGMETVQALSLSDRRVHSKC